MEINEIVCSLENAKKLKELHVNQQSYFMWYIDDELYPTRILTTKFCKAGEFKELRLYSAFTAQELLNILRFKSFINISPDNVFACSVYYQPENGTDNSYSFQGNNLADLLAKVLIAQIKEGEFKNE